MTIAEISSAGGMSKPCGVTERDMSNVQRNRSPVRRLAPVLTAMLLAFVSACAEPAAETEPSIGQVEHTESMKAQGMALVTNEEGAARLVGTLVNTADEPDRLVGVDVDPTVESFDVVIADGPIILPPGEPVTLARDAQMTVFTDRFVPGFRPELRLIFLNSAPIVTTVPVETQTGPYAEVEVLAPPDGDISPE